jgi:DNA-binding NarL/FixJ family response regulator
MNALNDTISILIADDHPLIRKGLRLSVEDDPGLKVVLHPEGQRGAGGGGRHSYRSRRTTLPEFRHYGAVVAGIAGAGNGRAKLDSLTPTERRVMGLIAAGNTSKEIGAQLSIHYRTVENHRTNICRKLELDGEGANALLRFALQNKNLL